MQLARGRWLDHGYPGGVELVRRSRRASPGDAVGLLDERDADAFRARDVGRRDQVARRHPSAGAMTENERGDRLTGGMQVTFA